MAVSLARAAGVKNPVVLGVIGLAAGLAANGANLGGWLKSGVKFAAESAILSRVPGVGPLFALADFAVANMQGAFPEERMTDKEARNVYAVEGGEVVDAGSLSSDGSYGYGVVIKTNEGLFHRYGHFRQDDVMVEVGQVVEKGELIGYYGEGIVGWSTGPHVHFEVRKGNMWGERIPYEGGAANQCANWSPLGAGGRMSGSYYSPRDVPGGIHRGYDWVY